MAVARLSDSPNPGGRGAGGLTLGNLGGLRNQSEGTLNPPQQNERLRSEDCIVGCGTSNFDSSPSLSWKGREG